MFGNDRRYRQTLYKVNNQGEWSLVLETPHDTWAVAYGDRVFIFNYVKHHCYTLEIRDLNGNTIFYGDDFYANDISAYSEDAFVLKIYGIDQNMYVTVIDQDGNFAFEPIKMRYAYGQENISRLGEGHFIIEGDDYYFDADFNIVSITGEVVSCNVSESHGVDARRIQNAIFQNDIAIIHDSGYNGDYLLSMSGDAIIPWYEVVG